MNNFKRATLTLAVLSAISLSACSDDDDSSTDIIGGGDTPSEQSSLKRIATMPLGAEVTGIFVTDNNELFFNAQHPDDANTVANAAGIVFNKGTVGAVTVPVSQVVDAAELALPSDDNEKQLIRVAAGDYQVLTQQGDMTVSGTDMGSILAEDGSELKSSNDPDFNGVISDGTNNGYYLYTNWEDRPGGMSRMHLSNFAEGTGFAQKSAQGMLNFGPVNGTWVNCFGTVSPWGTPLTSEELYFDNTADWFDASAAYFSNPVAVALYKGYMNSADATPTAATQWPNPYDYGYITEIGVDGTAKSLSVSGVKVNKHEVLGRFSHENSVVMPDNRTVFLSDDGTGTVFFKFVADVANDLSAGTLYAAKVTQTGGSNPAEAAFDIEWIKLAHANEADIEAAIREYDGTLGEAKYITDDQVTDWAKGNSAHTDNREAFLESRKAAVAKGATGEFRKMEGVNINYNLAKSQLDTGKPAFMYMAMSEYTKTMSDAEGDIQLDGTHGKCGAVYRMKLTMKDGLVDTNRMEPAIIGANYDENDATNQCGTDGLSNPDNLVVLDDGRVLIGEDTGNHQNNMLWVFEDAMAKQSIRQNSQSDQSQIQSS